MVNNLLFPIADISEKMVKILDGAMGICYPILFNAIGVISIFLQFMIFQIKAKNRLFLWGF